VGIVVLSNTFTAAGIDDIGSTPSSWKVRPSKTTKDCGQSEAHHASQRSPSHGNVAFAAFFGQDVSRET
jgi:hypothetical protein